MESKSTLAALAAGLVPVGLLLLFHFGTLFGIHPRDDPFPFGMLARLAIIAASLFVLSGVLGGLWPEKPRELGLLCATPILAVGLPLGFLAAVEATHLLIVLVLAVVFAACAIAGSGSGSQLRRPPAAVPHEDGENPLEKNPTPEPRQP